MTDLPSIQRTALLTCAALIGFAGNSLLCRMALGAGHIDAATFTTLRLASGALVLYALARPQRPIGAGSWRAALALAAYAVCFSFAYLRLLTSAGALILFSSVQLAMLSLAIIGGERPKRWEWVGFVIAMSGLVVLTLPGADAPELIGTGLMVAAGVAWAIYTLLGRASSATPLAANADNFLRALPLSFVVSVVSWENLRVDSTGVLLAIFSGGLTSGVGYTFWYAALKGLTSTRAAIVQLSVPVLAAMGGVLILGEEMAARLAVAGLVILAGISLAIFARVR